MRIRQSAYFQLSSQQVTAAEMTARLRIEPDRIKVRGSQTSIPVVPRSHSWRVICAGPGMTVDEQIAKVVGRLQHRQQEIGLLARELSPEGSPCGATMGVIRNFDVDEGEEEETRVLIAEEGLFETMPGQHQLLGWHLGAETLNFLLAVGAELDVDEYG